jgi:hypothetical protein
VAYAIRTTRGDVRPANPVRSGFQALEPAWLWLSMNQNRTDEGGDCFGDSGGPKFFDGNTTLIVATVTPHPHLPFFDIRPDDR